MHRGNSMKRLLFVAVLGALAAIPASAQSVDASVSYSYFRLGGSGGLNQNGVSGSLAYNPISWVGFVGDFGGYHGTVTSPTPAGPGNVSLNTYTYMFGPR